MIERGPGSPTTPVRRPSMMNLMGRASNVSSPSTSFIPVTTYNLKGTKRDKLHAMHVKELIKTNYSER